MSDATTIGEYQVRITGSDNVWISVNSRVDGGRFRVRASASCAIGHRTDVCETTDEFIAQHVSRSAVRDRNVPAILTLMSSVKIKGSLRST